MPSWELSKYIKTNLQTTCFTSYKDFLIFLKCQKFFQEEVKKWHLSELFWDQIRFSWRFRLKFIFPDRIKNIDLIWIFEFLPLLPKGFEWLCPAGTIYIWKVYIWKCLWVTIDRLATGHLSIKGFIAL